MRRVELGVKVSNCAMLAALLEVSAYPKPGNVHRTRNLSVTRFEHFLAGSVAIGSSMQNLALCGYDAAVGDIRWEEIGIGRHIFEALKNTFEWQKGGNINLGIVLLFAPLSAAGGATLYSNSNVNTTNLRWNLKQALHSTTPKDTATVFKAIKFAMTPKVLGKSEELDVLDGSSLKKIFEQELTLIDVFHKCSEKDNICREWVSDFKIIFEEGYPCLKNNLKQLKDVNLAVVETFLFILSKYPDSLITRKRGRDKASEISEKAKLILEKGGVSSEIGIKMLYHLDDELHGYGGGLNPGTTADLTAASLFIVLLEGWRP